jgi:hypothetical protein
VNFFRSLTLPAFAVVLICTAASTALSANQSKGIYPVDADSIGIPLMFTLMNALTLLVVVSAAVGVIRLGMSGTRARRILYAVVVAALHAIALLIAVDAALFWLMPHHHAISAAYGFFILIIAIRAIADIREISVNIAMERDATRHSP